MVCTSDFLKCTNNDEEHSSTALKYKGMKPNIKEGITTLKDLTVNNTNNLTSLQAKTPSNNNLGLFWQIGTYA